MKTRLILLRPLISVCVPCLSQSQKEELDLVLQKVDVMGKDPPAGQTENHSSTADSRLWDEQRKEKAFEQSGPGQAEAREEKKSTEGAREDTESTEGAREEKERMEVVEKSEGAEGGKKRHWEEGEKEARREGHQEKEWKKGREEVKKWKQKEERKERKRESDWKHGKDKRREWREKVDRRRMWEKGRDWSKDWEKKRDRTWKDKKEDQWRGEKKEKDWNPQKDGWKRPKEWREERGIEKEKQWQGSADKTQRARDHVDYWKRQRQKLENSRPPLDCRGIAECAKREGLVPVKQAEFQGLLGAYLSKLEEDAGGSKGAIITLVGEFFVDGLFAHDKIRFREFAEDVADMLEDAVEGDHRAEEVMEEFEREALRKFAMAGGGEWEARKRGKDGRVWG